MSAKYFWMKLREDFFNDTNIIFIETQKDGEKYIIFWQKLLLLTIKAETPGMLRFTEQMPYDDVLLATVTRTDISVVRCAMALFQKLRMVEILDDKTIYIEAVQNLIGKECESAERVRRLRERRAVSKQLPSPQEEQESDSYSETDEDEEIEIERPLQCNATVTDLKALISKIRKQYPHIPVDYSKKVQGIMENLSARGLAEPLYMQMVAKESRDAAAFIGKLSGGDLEADFLALPVCEKCGSHAERLNDNGICTACNFAEYKARDDAAQARPMGEKLEECKEIPAIW